MTLVGYARVSTLEQDPSLQVNALTAAGCDKIFVEHASGARTDRPELKRALDYMRAGDVLVVWKLDRLGRSTQHLVNTVAGLREQEMGFKSLTEGMDTTTPSGQLLFTIMAALAQFERDLIRERTLAGLAAARARGKTVVRKSSITAARMKQVNRMLSEGTTISEVAKVLGVSRATIYRALAATQQGGAGGVLVPDRATMPEAA